MLTQTLVIGLAKLLQLFNRTAQGVASHRREIAMIWDVRMILSHSRFFFLNLFIFIYK